MDAPEPAGTASRAWAYAMELLETPPTSKHGNTQGKPYLLNLACGTRAHRDWINLDSSWAARLAQGRAFPELLRKTGLLSKARYEALKRLTAAGVRVSDLRCGIPFPDCTFDVCYHSHFLEHLPRLDAKKFIGECYRVLKPGGVLRVVVPDLGQLVDAYAGSQRRLAAGERDALGLTRHDQTIEALFEQFVRAVPAGTTSQHPLVARLERLLRGSADRAGETHKWAYDEYSLYDLLHGVGFTEIRRASDAWSRVSEWTRYGLDTKGDGSELHPGSLYMEAVRPLDQCAISY